MNGHWWINLRNHSIQSQIALWQFIVNLTAVKLRSLGLARENTKKKSRANISPAVCSIHNFTPSNSEHQEKQEIQYLVAFMQIWHFPPPVPGSQVLCWPQIPGCATAEAAAALCCIDSSLFVINKQASLKSWAACVPNLQQLCQMSNPSVCRPILWLHLWDWIVAHSSLFFFFIIQCYWREIEGKIRQCQYTKYKFQCLSLL